MPLLPGARVHMLLSELRNVSRPVQLVPAVTGASMSCLHAQPGCALYSDSGSKRAESKMHMHILHNAGFARVNKWKLVQDLSTISLNLQHERRTERNEHQIFG